MNFAPFFKRICEKMKIKSQRELAEILKLSPSSIYSAKRRNSVPPRWILKLSQSHNFNVNWLLTGMGEPLMDNDNAFKSISLVEARLSAGGGSLEVGAETVDKVPFRLDWLHRKGVPDKMVMFKISGDSMEPVVHDGDTVLVDMSRKEIVSGKIFAIGVDDAIVLKRVEKKEDHIRLISENNIYPPEIHSAGQTQGIRIIGKMIWSSREYV
ncbi:MAG: helix-turn-helix transcriptional regulator [Deltaproteobacteria bacterium]|nr:helix-turn-helix transcriptional regulator [Deltaproteobacteria bacterium]